MAESEQNRYTLINKHLYILLICISREFNIAIKAIFAIDDVSNRNFRFRFDDYTQHLTKQKLLKSPFETGSNQ